MSEKTQSLTPQSETNALNDELANIIIPAVESAVYKMDDEQLRTLVTDAYMAVRER